MVNEKITGLPFHWADGGNAGVVERLLGPEVLTILNECLHDGDELCISGSTVIVALETGGYIVDAVGNTPATRMSDIDVYVTGSTYTRLIEMAQSTEQGTFSTHIEIGDRRLDVINVDKVAKQWKGAITPLLTELGPATADTDTLVVPSYPFPLNAAGQEVVSSYIVRKLTEIVHNLDGDVSPVNFLKHNGLLPSEAVGVVMTKREDAPTLSLSDPLDTLHSEERYAGQVRQYRNGVYTGMVETDINPDSLTGVLLYLGLLDKQFEVPQSLLPYKLGTGIARLVRTVAERKIQLAGKYEYGAQTVDATWYNALYCSAKRISVGDFPVKLGDAFEQGRLAEKLYIKLQEEFARAASSDTVMAAAQMFMALPMSSVISAEAGNRFRKYHARVLPNSIGHADFLARGLYFNLDGEKDSIKGDRGLEDAQEFMSNLLHLYNQFYPKTPVDVVHATDATSGSGLTYYRGSNPENMSEVMALILLSLGYTNTHRSAILQICSDWKAKGDVPVSYTSGLCAQFDMGVDEAEVVNNLIRFESAVASFSQT